MALHLFESSQRRKASTGFCEGYEAMGVLVRKYQGDYIRKLWGDYNNSINHYKETLLNNRIQWKLRGLSFFRSSFV